MNHHGMVDSPKYPDTPSNQPGLEVNQIMYIAPNAEHVEAKQAWAADEREGLQPAQTPRRIFGLSVGTFWAIIVLLCVILAGGIGGGVGAGLASKKTCSGTDASSNTTTTITVIASGTKTSALSTSSATSTTSSTNPSISPAPTTLCETETSFNGSSLIPLDSEGNPIPLGTVQQQTFQVFCNTNWPAGSVYGNPGVRDIMYMYQPDLLHCVAACAEYNAGYERNSEGGREVSGGRCQAVALLLKPGGNCYLKNATGINDTSSSGPVTIDSALLL